MPNCAVTCYTCSTQVWQGAEPVETDGQALLTAYADSTPGPACPSGRIGCPHKAAAIALALEEAAKRRPVTSSELAEVKSRLEKLEPKARA